MNPLKSKIHSIIFKHDTFSGKLFDLLLIIFVFFSVLAVMLESVDSYFNKYQSYFYVVEWFFTGIFSIELLLRIYSSESKKQYIFSFYGIIDIISILPSYLVVFFPTTKAFMIIRIMRMLRLFRILKLSRYISAGSQLERALIASREKIVVFLFFVSAVVIIVGSLMYFVEPKESGFTSIPAAVYWAVVTMTTVGYGDITPVTTVGKIISTILMMVGYGVLAVPTGIISAEVIREEKESSCDKCSDALIDDNYCSQCGRKLN